ncbi:MAG: HAMP domain-containing histidine kinase [Alphaproteobacteria bacterium]|nr:HAMP domain-containing histidine kinase [Alphaproteobacteria bacterium]
MKLNIDGALPSSPSLADHEAEVLAQLNEAMAERRSPGRALVQPFAAFVVCLALWEQSTQLALVTMVATVVVVVGLNQVALFFFARDKARRERAEFWRAWMTGGVASIGLAWGLGIWLVYVSGPSANDFGLIALAAVVGVGGIAYCVIPSAAISFVWLALAPVWLLAVYELAAGHQLTAIKAACIPFFPIYAAIMTNFSLMWGRDLRQLMLRHREAVTAEGRLERQVQARTRDLEARTYELLMERDRAIAASRAKTQFLASISHEFRTPLNSILGFAETMRMRLFGDLGNARYEQYAEDIFQSGRQLQEILDGLVALSHIEGGRFVAKREPVDLARVVEDCLRDHSQLADSRSARVDIRIAEDARMLTADTRSLRLIVGNLLSNALRFGGERGDVQIATRLEVGETVCIYVVDRGAGMSEEQISLALEPYQQIDNLLARRRKGAGLGLPIVRALVDLHGGRFSIDSAPGRGTRVEVRLPREPLQPARNAA